MTGMDGDEAKEELFPGLVSELFWTLNKCVQTFARGSAGLAPRATGWEGSGPGASSLSVSSGIRVLGSWVLQLTRLLGVLPRSLAWFPSPLPAFWSQATRGLLVQAHRSLSASRPLSIAT